MKGSMHHMCLRVALLLLLLTGAALITKGGYIKLKANLASLLIESSWVVRESGSEPIKPWPWADTSAIARIMMPRLGISHLVMKDASGESLAFGPGSMRPEVLLAGSGHSVIAGHRDTHFKFLSDLLPGDRIELENFSGQYQTYQVARTRVMDVRHGDLVLDIDVSGVTLITCWPFDAITPGGPLRYVVETVPVG